LKKEAKNFYLSGRDKPDVRARAQRAKSFFFFFFRKRRPYTFFA
jgi:hypothetical protein